MNNSRRTILKQAIACLKTAEGFVSKALYKEQDCLDNMLESLEGTMKYEKMEEAVDQLEDAIEHISCAQECIENASL